MALLLNIDTATEHASVCFSKDGKMIAIKESVDQKNHGAFLQPAIKELSQEINIELSSIDAIAVTDGPGSYTGLRVGMASAKGLCYALNKPLILLNTLQVMANAASRYSKPNMLLCPMIDARRMEVFTAMYDNSLKNIIPTAALIIDENSFQKELESNAILFNGNGYNKLKNILTGENVFFTDVQHNSSHMISLSEEKYAKKNFSDLAYSEPFYVKEFFSPAPKK